MTGGDRETTAAARHSGRRGAAGDIEARMNELFQLPEDALVSREPRRQRLAEDGQRRPRVKELDMRVGQGLD
jgi:hypothetical protein